MYYFINIYHNKPNDNNVNYHLLDYIILGKTANFQYTLIVTIDGNRPFPQSWIKAIICIQILVKQYTIYY